MTAGEEPDGLRRSLTQDFVLRLITRVAMIAIGLAQAVVIARWLGPEGKGVLVLLLWAPGLIIDCFGGFKSASAWAIGKERFSRRRVLQTVVALWLIASVLGSAAVSASYLVQDLPVAYSALLAGVLYVPATVAVRYCMSLGMGMRWVAAVNRSQLAFQGATATAVITALVIGGVGPGGVVWAMGAGCVIGIAASRSWVRRIAPFGITFDTEVMRVLISKGAVFALALTVSRLTYRADLLLVDWFMTAEDVGIYSQGVGVIELALQVPNALAMVIFSHSVAASDAEKFRRRGQRIARRAIPLLALVAALLCAIAPFFIPFMFGEDFRPAVPVVWALAPGIVGVGVFQLVVSELNGRGRPEVGLYAAGTALALNVLLNIWWIPAFGIVGAALASSVSYIVMGAWMLVAQTRAVSARQ